MATVTLRLVSICKHLILHPQFELKILKSPMKQGWVNNILTEVETSGSLLEIQGLGVQMIYI